MEPMTFNQWINRNWDLKTCIYCNGNEDVAGWNCIKCGGTGQEDEDTLKHFYECQVRLDKINLERWSK